MPVTEDTIATIEKDITVKERLFLEPLGDRVVIKRTAPMTTSHGGIALPENTAEKPANGQVVAVGPGYLDMEKKSWTPLSVKVGDHVIFNKFINTEFDLGPEKYLVMAESDILGIVKRKKAKYDSYGNFVEFVQ